jgi:hypothetical protein
LGHLIGHEAPAGGSCEPCKRGNGPFASCRLVFLPGFGFQWTLAAHVVSGHVAQTSVLSVSAFPGVIPSISDLFAGPTGFELCSHHFIFIYLVRWSILSHFVSATMADPSSSFSAAADAAHLADDSNDWKAIRTTVVANQSVDLPELGSFNLYKLTPPLKERADLDNWIDQVEKVLQGYNLHHLINKNIPWPRIRDPNCKKWHTLSLQVRSWLSSSIHHTVMQEINARGSDLYYADELFAEINAPIIYNSTRGLPSYGF